MVQGYKQEEVLDTPSDNCTIYRVSKEGKQYLMHEFESINDSDEYSFRVRKKLNQCAHLLPLYQQFEQGDNKYFISDYVDSDLLKLSDSRPGRVLQLGQLLPFLAQLIETLDELHSRKLIFRNLRPEKVLVREGKIYFQDFSLSQFLKRKERLFQPVGCISYMAPEYFSEDGYGPQVDIWALGVLAFYLLIHENPFKFKGNTEEDYRQEFKQKCKGGFSFGLMISSTNFDCPPLKGNKKLEDFFKKIFTLNPQKRITLTEMRHHPLLQGFFPKQMDPEMLEVIQESGRQSSIFLSKMYKFPCSKLLHKEQIILDFIEETSELFLLQCPEIYSEELRYRAQFAVLKVGLLKCRDLLEMVYGKRNPAFAVDPEEWKSVRSSSALNSVKEKFERKQKILRMIYKSAYLKVKQLEEQDPFFKDTLPDTFEEIKIPYRGNLSEMFETGRKNLAKAKGNRRLSRRLTQSLVRVIILFLVNRLFENEEQISVDFANYLQWSKKGDLEDLQEWIQTQQIANLKVFMKAVTSKYLS